MQDPPIESSPTSKPGVASDAPQPAGGRTYVAWIVILATVVIISGANLFLSDHVEQIGPQMNDAVAEFQGKYVVGAASMLPTSNDDLLANIDTSSGPIAQRLNNVVVIAELQGPDSAREDLEAIGQAIQEEDARAQAADRESYVRSSDRDVLRILQELYAEDTEPNEVVGALSADDKATLNESMGWFGQLALAPKGTDEAVRKQMFAAAQFVFGLTITGFMLVLGAGVLGLIGLVVLIINLANGKMMPRLKACTADHRLYLETFAIWIVVMFVGQFFASMIAASLPEQYRLLPIAVMFFGTLVSLCWPVVCGVSFADVRRDIGWSLPRPAWATPFYGVGGYMMGLPLLAIGVVLTFLLTFISGQMANVDPLAPTNGPAHPIVMELGGNWLVIMQVFLLGSVAAPLVEETMFRGVLYRHLREVSRGRRILVSVIFSTLLNAFIFAAIHPQGLAAIPALMSLAIAFTIAREMLDSLVPAMIMHGFSNGVALALGLVLFA